MDQGLDDKLMFRRAKPVKVSKPIGVAIIIDIGLFVCILVLMLGAILA